MKYTVTATDRYLVDASNDVDATMMVMAMRKTDLIKPDGTTYHAQVYELYQWIKKVDGDWILERESDREVAAMISKIDGDWYHTNGYTVSKAHKNYSDAMICAMRNMKIKCAAINDNGITSIMEA